MTLKKRQVFNISPPDNEWLKRQQAAERFTQRFGGEELPGSLGPQDDDCLPGAVMYRVIESGATIINDESDVVGTIVSGSIYSDELDLSCPLSLVITLNESPYEIPTDADQIVDVWFDYLRATPEVHWQFTAPRTINVLSPIMEDTLVRVEWTTFTST